MAIKIFIGGDLVPTPSNYSLFKEGNVKELIGEKLMNLFSEADFMMMNLEVPLTDQVSPISKCGPNLIAPTYTIEGVKSINPYFYTLANNHILDQGKQGLYSTVSVLDKYQIGHAGTGGNLSEASKPYIFEKDGKKIGIYCCAEHEFSIATNTQAGANPFDPLESLDHIAKLKGECDYVIVLYHGGKEHYRYPSPYLQKVCRKIVEKGADLVVCQHSHCIGCEEKWKNGTIVYGQGNFLFDHSDSEFWQTSLLIELEISFNINIKYHPLVKRRNVVRLAELEREEILKDFQKRSAEILENNFVDIQYSDFAKRMNEEYLNAFNGSTSHSIIYRGFNKLTGYKFQKYYLKRKYKKQNLLNLRNYIECEAHRELLLRGLGK